ncbi:MAG: integral rane sensor signal transduction histidine kinase [Sphingobacteriales bacterium]|nr:integral rane sensor signal transduction histidine kinase [Sphingobacteriales bacterium]
MAIALLGVVAMQYYFIRESFRLKSQMFDQSVNEALKNVIYKIEKRDAILFMKRKAAERSKEAKNQKKRNQEEANKTDVIIKRPEGRFTELVKIRQRKIDQDFKMRDSLLRARYPKALLVDKDFYETYLKNPNEIDKVRFDIKIQEYVDDMGRVMQNVAQQLYVENPLDQKVVMKKGSDDSVRYFVIDPVWGARIISLPRVNPRIKRNLKRLVREQLEVKKVNKYLDSVNIVNQKEAVFTDLAKEYEQINLPLKKRINAKLLDTLLKFELTNRGIHIPYNYQISLANEDSVIFYSVSDKNNKLQPENSYTTALFPKEMIGELGKLTVNFPNKNSMLMSNISVLLPSSAALLIILICCFGYTIFIILRQKKLSEMKTDFINNMTHEFKTPVATIMIASEALKDPELTADKSRIHRLAGIIYDENIRLGNHIERVLNIAKIDKGDLKLEHKEVDVNDLLAAIIDSMALQLQKRNATVNLSLNATKAIILGDELHLSNVIFNLIDNANKYSKDDPEICISTANVGNKLIIKVADKGIGMNRDQQAKIFDQFYRIPTGNLHDVKGFGLGLSYVHNIIKRLNGSISVKSEQDKGSEFEIVLPLAKSAN